MTQDFRTQRINRTEFSRSYSEQEIKELVLADLVRRAELSGSPAGKVTISKKDRTGTSGFETYAEATIVVDHNEEPVQ
jgi:hypothetical protein